MSMVQLSVFMENRAGQLAEVTSALTEQGIDLRAVNIAETADYGILRMITSDQRTAAAILSAKDFLVTATKVVAVAVPDRPGGLNEVVLLMARENIDIEYMYSVFGQQNGMAYMIFRVDDPEKLTAALAAEGFPVVSGEDMGVK